MSDEKFRREKPDMKGKGKVSRILSCGIINKKKRTARFSAKGSRKRTCISS